MKLPLAGSHERSKPLSLRGQEFLIVRIEFFDDDQPIGDRTRV